MERLIRAVSIATLLAIPFAVRTAAQEPAPQKKPQAPEKDVLPPAKPTRGPEVAASPSPSPKPSASPKVAPSPDTPKGLTADTWSGLELRSIGPALTSGRVVDIAVDPTDTSRWFVAAAAGGVWRTLNAGISFTPVFDGEASFAIGSVAIDPTNPLVVWVGSGENNSQRVSAYGDGVYKSEDGGTTWKNMGLKTSEHLSTIRIDPRNGDTVYVAAQGPLWAPGGERGLYKTTDGGKTWKAVLTISENTGVTDVSFDPRNPNVLYAAAYQRRRHVWTLIDGGPESAIYKSTDAGASWTKVSKGLPKENMGRIGLAVSPVDPDVVYAVIEAANKAGGFFRSTDQGASWEKRGPYVPGGPQYYNEIVADPKEKDRVYSMDVFLQVTNDGGKTWGNLGETNKHVDNHVIWVDPHDTRHYLVGCDGGVYESFDKAATWRYFGNLPVTQFYRVSADNASPVYNVYGGTQDNFSLTGPSRTTNVHGIANSDWSVTAGGDGFWTVADPEDPTTVYAESQYGVLTRFDRKTGESLPIQPQAAPGEDPLRWNWDSPIIVSPHQHTRLYFAAQRVFRSDDRGNSWRAISTDLTRRIDRNALPVMGKVWGPDAVAKNASTSFYGNIVSLSESPLKDGLLYVGTDDGALQVTEDGGANWRREITFPGVPDKSYVRRLAASAHDAGTMYVAFDNHQMGDFKPYLFRSTDRGRTFTSIVSNLPTRGSVYALAEDPKDRDLLFVGTEFGLYFTHDGGKHWVQLKGGLPTIQVRDLFIHKRENDLVVGTFGRGIYILDDYTPLREARPVDLDKDALVFPARKGVVYMASAPLGLRGKAFQGESYFTTPNPPFGALFTYYLKEEAKTRKKRRQEAEKEAEKKGAAVPYPMPADFRLEAAEEDPAVIVTIADADGQVVRRLEAPAKAGFQRVAWDLRYAPSVPTSLKPPKTDNPFVDPPQGPMVLPGRYTATFARRLLGRLVPFGEPVTLEAAPGYAVPTEQRAELLRFQQKTARLQRAVLAASEVAGATDGRLQHVKKSLLETPGAEAAWSDEARALEARLRELRIALEGDSVLAGRNEPVPPSISDRVDAIVSGQWTATAPPTETNRQAYDFAAAAFEPVLQGLHTLVEVDLRGLEDRMEQAAAPWTPGRLPTWKRE